MPTLGMGSIRPSERSSRSFLSTIRCRRSIPISWSLSTTPSVSAPSTRRDANGMSRIGVFEPQHTHKSGEANAHNFFVEIKQVGGKLPLRSFFSFLNVPDLGRRQCQVMRMEIPSGTGTIIRGLLSFWLQFLHGGLVSHWIFGGVEMNIYIT